MNTINLTADIRSQIKHRIAYLQRLEWFENYITSHSDEFSYNPYVVTSDDQSIEIQFEGIPHLNLKISSRYHSEFHVEIFVNELNRFWDILFDIEISPIKNKDGKWYCEYCEESCRQSGKQPTHWETEQQMFEDHVFKEIGAWCKENLKEDLVFACWGVPEKNSHQVQIIKKVQIELWKEKAKLRCQRMSFLPVVNQFYELYMSDNSESPLVS